ncbi:MAG: T9SS type A sorting domain-containing protein, partial [Bacteroidota bacterium]
REKIQFTSLDHNPKRFIISDLSGKIWMQGYEIQSLDVTPLPQGGYLVKAFWENGSSRTMRFIKN